jgi:hypothetical protein
MVFSARRSAIAIFIAEGKTVAVAERWIIQEAPEGGSRDEHRFLGRKDYFWSVLGIIGYGQFQPLQTRSKAFSHPSARNFQGPIGNRENSDYPAPLLWPM